MKSYFLLRKNAELLISLVMFLHSITLNNFAKMLPQALGSGNCHTSVNFDARHSVAPRLRWSGQTDINFEARFTAVTI